MRQIAYFSTAAVPQTPECIHAILVSSRINNRLETITGLLVAGGNRYMQVIEGERSAVERLYATIRRDQRHLAITTLIDRPIMTPAFADWSMAYRREPVLGHFDSFPETLRYLTQQVGDIGLRRQIEHFTQPFIASSGNRETPWGRVA